MNKTSGLEVDTIGSHWTIITLLRRFAKKDPCVGRTFFVTKHDPCVGRSSRAYNMFMKHVINSLHWCPVDVR